MTTKKRALFLCIIYALCNTINTKVYIGQSWTPLKQRWNRGHGYLGSHKIHKAIKKYGKEKFYYEVLALCSTKEVAEHWETYFITKFDSVNSGYNILSTGGKHGWLGRKHTEESLAKMSKSHMGSHAHLGFKHTEKTKANISASTLRQFATQGHPSLGVKLSEERKKHLSEVSRGPEIELEICKYYTDNDLSLVAVGERYNCTGGGIRKILIRNNISRRTKWKTKK
jgi:group I intron endonuclease